MFLAFTLLISTVGAVSVSAADGSSTEYFNRADLSAVTNRYGKAIDDLNYATAELVEWNDTTDLKPTGLDQPENTKYIKYTYTTGTETSGNQFSGLPAIGMPIPTADTYVAKGSKYRGDIWLRLEQFDDLKVRPTVVVSADVTWMKDGVKTTSRVNMDYQKMPLYANENVWQHFTPEIDLYDETLWPATIPNDAEIVSVYFKSCTFRLVQQTGATFKNNGINTIVISMDNFRFYFDDGATATGYGVCGTYGDFYVKSLKAGQTCNAIFVEFEGDNKFVGCASPVPVTLTADDVFQKVEAPAGFAPKAGNTVKIFVWDSITGLKPLTNVTTYTVPALATE